MTSALQVIFWASLAHVVWSYFVYPLTMAALVAVRRRETPPPGPQPTVTLVIAAYNEERDIANKLENSLTLEYPADKLEVIVASDRSTDGTHEIVRGFADRGVTLVVLPERGGKTAGQNLAAEHATGDVLVFTDATTEFASTTLRDLLRPFDDSSVGCVGAELEYVSEEGSAVGRGAGAYWRYERKVKALEASANSLIGVSGCLYAVRRSLYTPLDPQLISDFVIAGDIYEKGYRTTYARGAVSREVTNETSEREFTMRVRVIVRSWNAIVQRAHMLNVFRFGWFSYQLYCHKVMRYTVPHVLLIALATNIALAALPHPLQGAYVVLLALHLSVYGTAVLGWWTVKTGIRVPLIHIPYYFFHANAAALVASWRFLRGERMVTWSPVR
ncbi:MAG: cellulose synthase/poly-beta-1,6-N-acetylglucosamine synthase-like glycosyltransferase [Bradymonadia bacterium]|jgi:cellulose synthase/poly-beta-1,6-N-acetylglucosamine synthase-like glycosyltransferase